MTESQVRDAVRNLQFFAGLEATGSVDAETAELLQKPRCGVPDVAHHGFRNRRSVADNDSRRFRRYSLQGQRWSRTNLTWSLDREPSSLRHSSGVDGVRRALSRALEMWARQSGLQFSEVRRGGDLRVFFHRGFHGDGYPFDGEGSVLAHAFFPGSGRGGDVHFDDDEPWNADDDGVLASSSASVFAVALHEFGHSLGLSHSPVEGSLMFPWYAGAPEDHLLPEDDRRAIQHLYGKATFDTDFEQAEGGKREGEDETENEVDEDDDATTTPDDDNGDSTPPVADCASDFDAVAVIRSEMWVFKGRHFWRLPQRADTDAWVLAGDPVELSAFWYGLPADVERVDAVYERPDHKIVFFSGENYFVLTGNSHLESGPTPIQRLGLPDSVRKVDAAMRWGWNGKTYLFSGSMYWRLDEEIQHVELDYPRDLPSVWRGLPHAGVDAAFRHTDGRTYFFAGKEYWRFDDRRMRVDGRGDIRQRWMRCRGDQDASHDIRDPFQGGGGNGISAAANPKRTVKISMSFFTAIIVSIALPPFTFDVR